MKIEDLRSAFGESIVKKIDEHRAASRGVSSIAKEILLQQVAKIKTLIEIELTERSDIHKSSILNHQYSIPACPG